MKRFIAAAAFASFLAMPAMAGQPALIGVGAVDGGVRFLGGDDIRRHVHGSRVDFKIRPLSPVRGASRTRFLATSGERIGPGCERRPHQHGSPGSNVTRR
jgi:hypothetical protein